MKTGGKGEGEGLNGGQGAADAGRGGDDAPVREPAPPLGDAEAPRNDEPGRTDPVEEGAPSPSGTEGAPNGDPPANRNTSPDASASDRPSDRPSGDPSGAGLLPDPDLPPPDADPPDTEKDPYIDLLLKSIQPDSEAPDGEAPAIGDPARTEGGPSTEAPSISDPVRTGDRTGDTLTETVGDAPSERPTGSFSGEFTSLGISALIAVVAFALIGVWAVRNLTLAMEGHMEFKGDSLTKRSRLGGFFMFTLWAIAVALGWSFFIDWYWFEDLGFATAALWQRVEIVLIILAEMGDS